MLFIGVQYQVEISVGIEDLPLDQMVSGFTCKFLYPVNNLLVHGEAAELIQDFVVVDLFVSCTRYFVWVDDRAIIHLLFLHLAGLVFGLSDLCFRDGFLLGLLGFLVFLRWLIILILPVHCCS